MRVTGLALVSLIACSLKLSAQPDLVDLNFVSFHSEQEKSVLTNYVRKAESDLFAMFIASGSLMNDAKAKEARSRFEAFAQTYKDAKFQAKKNDRKTKQIYDDVHKTFLKKYQDDASFEHIFYNGNYNSTSATALLALVFAEAGIPYAVKEEADGVHLLAYPQSDNIRLEASSPTGIVTMNALFKETYVKALKERKLISAQEAASQSTDALFDRYYFGNQTLLTVENLLGLQYLDDAQRNFEEKNFERSFAQAEKAYLLYPCAKTSYLLVVTGSMAFSSRPQQDSVKALSLAKVSRYTDQGITADMITSELARAMEDVLFDKGKREQAETYYRVLSTHVDNIQLKSDLGFVYNFEYGRYLNQQGKYREAMPYFEKAMAAKPDKLDAVNGFISNLFGQLSQSEDNIENLQLVEGYASTYPSLHSNNVFNNMLLSAYLMQSAIEYDGLNAAKGDKYRTQFEELIGKYPDVKPNGQLVGQAYSRAAVYFYRKGQTQKAKNLIATGLKYSPNNYELLTRQRMIN